LRAHGEEEVSSSFESEAKEEVEEEEDGADEEGASEDRGGELDVREAGKLAWPPGSGSAHP
jgi:hypothetical protein